MFRLLGLHHGPDISTAAAASLAGLPVGEARAALTELARASLLTEDAAGRLSCHELLRAYAAEQAAQGERPAECEAARLRLVDHYVRTARAASERLYPARGHVELPLWPPDVAPEKFASYEAALAWFDAEHRVLQEALIAMAAEPGLEAYCWTLAWYWSPILKRRGQLQEVAALQRTALACAHRLGDPVALAHVHYDLGHVSGRLGDFAESLAHLTLSLELFTELGDRANVGQVRHGLALLLTQQNRYAEALEHALEALRLRRAFAAPAVVAYSENAVGWIYAHLGRHAEALRHCGRALELNRESGSRSGAADTLDSIGFAYGGLANYGQAIAHYEQAVDIYRDIGDSESQSSSLVRLGDMQLAAGLPARARQNWEQALAVLAQTPGVDSGEVRARLAQLAAVDGTGIGAVLPA
jgi:tetratricopeptide (TPR) repeat protein